MVERVKRAGQAPKATQSPDGVTGRVRYDLDSLTDLALGLFRERGYASTSMEQLAQAAGVSKAAFYHHVGGKEELLERGMNRALDALFAMLDEPEATNGTALERFCFILRRVVELEHELLPEVTVLLRARGNTDVERAAVQRRRAFDRAVTAVLAEAQSNGEIRADLDVKLAARLSLGMATWIVEWYQPGGPIPVSRIADTLVSMTLTGVVRSQATKKQANDGATAPQKSSAQKTKPSTQKPS